MLKQSDMRLALNAAKMAKEGYSCAAIEESQFLFKTPCTKVREEKTRGVEFPGHEKVKAAIERHPAMLCQNQTARCLPCQNGMAKNPQTRWRRNGTAAPPPDRPEAMPPLPETPPAPTGSSSRAQRAQIVNMPAGYVYSHTSLPCAESFTLDASAQDSQHDTDCDPDMLTDEGTSAG